MLRRWTRPLGIVTALGGALSLVDCSSHPEVQAAPSSGLVKATDQVRLEPVRARVPTADPRKPSDWASLQQMLSEGWGKTNPLPGEAPVDRTPDGSPPPEPGPGRHLVARFVHTADFQLADDESPDRVVALDEPVVTDAAFRPQESYGCRTLDAVARTINRIDQGGAKIDVVLLGGDNVDNAQKNEVRWVLSVLDGGQPLECDSGEPDDPVPGPDNDGKDPFVPQGIQVPWLWVNGNHDVLAQGNFSTTADRSAEASGDYASGGTVVYTKAGPQVVQGTVVADPERATMTRSELVARVMSDPGKSTPRGHGLGAYAQKTGKVFYTYDVPGSPVRFLVLDTAAETGGAEGVVHQSDVDAFVKPELARAKAEGKWVVLASHHAQDKITDGSEIGGTFQPDALTPEAWAKVITSSPVILDMVGHAHGNRIRRIGQLPGGIWEMQCSAIADYPHQFRLLEIWDEDNGWISIRGVMVEYETDGNPVAAMGRELAVLDYTVGWGGGTGPGTNADRNVILWQRKP